MPPSAVKSWGYNGFGQLGNESLTDSNAPVDVLWLEGVAKLSANTYSSFATLDDGSVSAWGTNDVGQLGDDTLFNRTTSVPIDVLQGVTDIASGVDHTVAARDDGSVIAWGADANAQLGDGTINSTRKPMTVLPPGSAVLRVATTELGKSSFAY
ncbi:RCC1 domain-containing protein [Streptomyces sp. NBC_01217]|uniref:RCC1 domain-containing protein n=1 Tax=Streptomyces sp. NBC_01217 TaxID=2903779 RepID=UPI002E13E8A6|nr:hypothetical protein OG507_33385 [Streptomyces sp. NBC_01217]